MNYDVFSDLFWIKWGFDVALVTCQRSLGKAAFVAPSGGRHQQKEIITEEKEISIEPGQSVTKNTT